MDEEKSFHTSEQKDKSEQEHPKFDQKQLELLNHVFRNQRIRKQNKNTPRFLMRLGVKYLPEVKEFGKEMTEKIKDECKRREKWHLKNKKNVYLLDHLK